MRIAIIALAASFMCSTVALAAYAPANTTRTAATAKGQQVADYYSGKKVCRRVGSATVCN